MGYEAQIAGVGDWYPNKPVRNAIVQTLKKRSSVKQITKKRAALVEMIRDTGNGGGTGSVHTLWKKVPLPKSR